MKNDLTESERELKSEIMGEIEDAIDGYFLSFRLKSDNPNKLPSMSEIEDMVTELRSKTRDICLGMVSKCLDSFDESELVEAKKTIP